MEAAPLNTLSEITAAMVSISPGDAVLTRYGSGVVIRCFNDDGASSTTASWATVRLWRQPGKSIASGAIATLRVEDCILQTLVAAPGMVVRASVDDDTNGKTPEVKQQSYLIERYLPSQNIFIASSTTNESKNGCHSLARSLAVMSSPVVDDHSNKETDLENTSESYDDVGVISENVTTPATSSVKRYHRIRPDQIDASSISAKFYPILQDLINRGEKAWNMAMDNTPSLEDNVAHVKDTLSSVVTATSIHKDGTNAVANIISETSKISLETLNNSSSTSYTSAGEAINTVATKATLLTNAFIPDGLSLPQAQEIKQIFDYLRDEDLTTLFQRGRERLKDLVEDEIPQRTKKALEAVGVTLEEDEVVENSKGSIRVGMEKLRRNALASLDQLLAMSTDDGKGSFVFGNGSDAAAIEINTQTILDSSSTTKELLSSTSAILQAQDKFSQMFDYLSTVSSTDPQLLQIFSSISEKTKSWQEMTGRLLQTKTASLFMEGTARLRNRAADLLKISPGQIRGAVGGVGSGATAGDDLTRAFTEGDVAMAKLKSMEMGDAIRKRLFDAIELRSESSGGLDAIIAGSLTAISRTGESYVEKASALIKTSELENLSLASTLDAASGKISEDSIQSVISNLQNSATSAMKGTKETLIALLSKKSGYRDDVLLRLEQVFMDLESQMGQDMSAEEIVALARGEEGTLALFQPVAMRAAKEIEAQLDAAEQRMKESKHWDPKADDALGKIRQITRGELSMTDILDMAAGFLDDEEVVAKSGGFIVRAETLLDEFEAASAKLGDGKASVGDASAGGIMEAVTKAGITKDVVMKSVQTLNVDKLLDDTTSAMTDEVARRQLISSAGDTALDFLLKILPSMPVPPFDGVREGLVYHLSNLSMAGFKVKKEDIYIEIAGIRAAAQDNTGDIPQQSRVVKASELLIIDIKNISAIMDDTVWSFEQTYMPYLKGNGKANTRLWSGSIRLKFELRRRIVRTEDDPKTGKQKTIWEPVLCLNDRTCSIGGIELVFQGEGRITWVANKLAAWLKNPLRDYVVGVIVTALTNNSGWLIDMLNQNLSPYWDFVMRTANLKLDELPKLARHHVTKAEIVDDNEVELVWRERVPLGLNILTNDESGYLKVIDLPRGTQARKVAQSKQLDPDRFKGSTIVSVNGRRYGADNRVDLFAALKDPARPKAILFRLASQDNIESLERKVEKRNGTTVGKPSTDDSTTEDNIVTLVDIADQGDIGIKFACSSDGFGLVVREYLRNDSVSPNDLLSHVNGSLVLGEKGTGKEKALSILERDGTKRPLQLGFVRPYLYSIVIEKGNNSIGGPSELTFKDNTIVFNGFAPSEGAAESGGVFVGDNLVFVNGVPVGAGKRKVARNGV